MIPMISSAVISDDGVYRYSLTRELCGDGPPMLFVMLNPSKATATVTDPTDTRCVGFGRREDAAWVQYVNLHALRATDPAELRRHRSPIGPDNDNTIRHAADVVVSQKGTIVAAWGPKPWARDRIRVVRDILWPFQLMCLGVSKDGSPRHPLMVKLDQPLIPWPVA